MAAPEGFSDKVAFVWKVADKLRGHFTPHEYWSVMLPQFALRRLDAVLEPTKAKVLAKVEESGAAGQTTVDPILKRVAGQARFYRRLRCRFLRFRNRICVFFSRRSRRK